MTTIGKLIRDARHAKGITYKDLERQTKIKSVFLQAIERGQWDKLPEYPVVLGFVKNIGSSLDLSSQKIVAFLRRDYPQSKTDMLPKPDVSREFRWSPKLTFFAGLAVVLFLVLGYLAFQFVKFASPPLLKVNEPYENQVVESATLKVSGKTDQDATIKVNNQQVLVNESGEFETSIEIFEGTMEVKIIARSRSGRETIIDRKIKPKLK